LRNKAKFQKAVYFLNLTLAPTTGSREVATRGRKIRNKANFQQALRDQQLADETVCGYPGSHSGENARLTSWHDLRQWVVLATCNGASGDAGQFTAEC
jgi:hypothetical protein